MKSTGRQPRRRRVLTVRARITAVVALLVATALLGAGLLVWAIERNRVENSVQREVQQELDEFSRFQAGAKDPETQEPLNLEELLYQFLLGNVPDDDELLVAWVGEGPSWVTPQSDESLVNSADFREAAAPLVTSGGSTRLHTDRGEILVTSQPVQQDSQTGALLVVAYLDEDRAELASTMRTYAIVALLSLIVITSAAAVQSGRLLRPLRSLRQVAVEIGESDLGRRIPETGNDDITALTRTVNGMLDRLESAFVSQRNFLDDAGHELKTPLTVLRGHLELLDPNDAGDVVETRDLLLDEVDRMSRLVADLIVLTKSERPDFLSVGEVSPVELVKGVLARARALGSREWTLDASESSASVALDPQRFTQALLALADNAVKHTDEGDQVGIGAEVVADRVRFWVRDTGPGVAPADRQRIFQRFARADVPTGDEGFGLGLSIVAAIAEAHGGIAYAADVPVGAKFVIDVPIAAAESPTSLDV